MKSSRCAVLVVPMATVLFATPALARDAEGPGACRQDLVKLCSKLNPKPAPGPENCVKALCPSAIPGTGGFVTCLQGLAVSKPCKDELNEMQAQITAWQTAFTSACGASGTPGTDVANFCNYVSSTTGPWPVMHCLHQAVIDNRAVNGQGVSAGCQTFLAQPQPPMGERGPGHRHHGPGEPPPGK